MGQHWTKYVEEFEHDEEREYVNSRKNKTSKKKLDHVQAKQMKEIKKNGTKYPKKSKR